MNRMIELTIVSAGFIVACRACYLWGIKDACNVFFKIGKEELLNENEDFWNFGLIKYKNHGLPMKFFGFFTDIDREANYMILREYAAGLLYSVHNQAEIDQERSR